MSVMEADESAVLLAAVEGGGTSFRLAVARFYSSGEQPEILHRTTVDSSHDDPQRTLQECAAFFQTHKPKKLGYHALGVATFGPVGLHFGEQNYGCILPGSPKKEWRSVNLLTPLIQACKGSRHLAIRVETDVNAPAFAEYQQIRRHQTDKLTSLAYITVGTGVGVGLVINGHPVHGRMHPEGGHVTVQPLEGDDFGGYSWGTTHSPYRGIHTVEGIASSVALTERLEQSKKGQQQLSRSVLSELSDDHEVWDHAANALANLCVTLILTTSIERIVLGGGVLKRKGLLEKIRSQTVHLLNGYLELPEDLSQFITCSTWGDDAGLVGAVVLAQKAYQEDGKVGTGESSKEDKGAFANGFLHGVVVGSILAVAATTLLGRRPSTR